MAGPWEQYGQSDGPWNSYAQPKSGIISEIGSDVGNVVKNAASNVADYLNPFSDVRHASYAKQANLPLGAGIAENLNQIAGTGSALATPITAPSNAAMAAATPLVAHPFQALNQAAGIDLPYEKAKEQAALALQGIRPAGASPVGRTIQTAPLSAEELKAAGAATFNDPQIKSINIPPSDVSALSGKIENDLIQRGNRPSVGNAPGTFAEVQRLNPPAGVQSVSVDDIRSARRALNITAKQRDPMSGRATPDAEAAGVAIGHIDDFLDNVAPEIKTANANYAAGSAADRLDYRSMKAARRAAKSGSGMNIENTMRQEVDKIPNRGLTPQEQALRDQIVMGTVPRNAMRTVGKLGVDGGLSLALHSGMAIGTGGTTIPVTAAATGIRKIGEALTKSQINQLSNMIRSRAPAGQMPVSSITKAKLLAALLSRANSPMLSGVMPSYADQNKP